MLDLHPGLMLFVLVIFFALMVFLNQTLYKPLIAFMDGRDRTIAEDLKSANEMLGNNDELNAKADAILVEAKAEANTVREKATNEAKSLADSKIESKTQELDEKYQSFLTELSKEKEELEKSLLAKMPLFKESLKNKMNSL